MKYQLNILEGGKWFLCIRRFLFWKRLNKAEAQTFLDKGKDKK